MDAIKGSELQIPDAIFAWVLDGQGGVKPLADNDIIDKEKPCWLHLNYTHSDSADWLAATPLLPNNVRDALAGESTRPLRVVGLADIPGNAWGDAYTIVLVKFNNHQLTTLTGI